MFYKQKLIACIDLLFPSGDYPQPFDPLWRLTVAPPNLYILAQSLYPDVPLVIGQRSENWSGPGNVIGLEEKNMKPDQRRPLCSRDTLLQTDGCRHSNPDICRNHSTEKKCAFVREDGLCVVPPRSWNAIFHALTQRPADTKADVNAFGVSAT